MHLITIFSLICTVCLGGYVLGRGNWEEMHLKRAGILLLTIVALFMAYIDMAHSSVMICQRPGDDLLCATFHIYFIARNLGIMMLQLACGRDAIIYKNKDRRGRFKWQTRQTLSRQGQL